MPDKEEKIRARAYELWEREGRSHGSHERHWAEAARQIEAETAAADVKPARKRAAPKPAASPLEASESTSPKRAAKAAGTAASKRGLKPKV